MFSIARLYNSACSYASIPIRIYPIMMSIVFHHYKTLKDNNLSTSSIEDTDSNNHNSVILQKELDKWKPILIYCGSLIETCLIKCYNYHTNIQMQ